MTTMERQRWSEIQHPHMVRVLEAQPEDKLNARLEDYTNVVVNLGDVDAYVYLYYLVEGKDAAAGEVLNRAFSIYLGIKYWRSAKHISSHMIDNLCMAIEHIDNADLAKVGTIVSEATHELFGIPQEVYTQAEHNAHHDASFKAQVLLRNIAERHDLHKHYPHAD